MAFPSPPRRTRWAMLAVVAAALSTGAAMPATASAGRIADERAQAARVQAELNHLYARVDVAVQSYDKAVSRLHSVKQQMARNAVRLRQAKQNLAAARLQLARVMVAAYKGGSPDVAAYVLGAGSFNDLIDRLDLVQRTSREQSQLLAQIQSAERTIKAKQVELRGERRTARRLVAQAAARRRHVEQLVTHEKSVLAGIQANIARLIKQQQERQARLARERAQAAARAAAAAAAKPSPPPSTGGGDGGSSGGSPPPSGPPPTPPPAGTLGQKAVAIAMGELGVPYVWGGASPAGFDCSGLTMWVYAQLGIHLDHYTGSQWNEGVHVSRSDLAPGDLVFFEPGIGHVGIYIGNNLFIHAPHTGTVVQISSLTGWYAAEYQGAVRIVG